MQNMRSIITLSLLGILFFVGCSKDTSEFKIKYDKYTLKNGLTVVLQEDKSDPIVSVAILYHVGSNREVKGRTGFAHLFEHMMFQESEHVGQDQFFKIVQGAGGTLNGGTWTDGTVYFEVVPKNALEKVLWLESDRMGFLLPTVTQEAFENQQAVVQNEKRQSYDNRPYGQTNYVIDKLLYPANHPYNWQTIGEMEDLRNATLKDVHDFYKKWYVPNNATLVISGDFDEEQTKELVKKYFGELKSSGKVEDMNPMPVVLNKSKRAYYEDNFAESPELNMVFPTVEQFTKDSYALGFLSELLAGNKKSPLYKIIVEEKKLAPSVAAFQNSSEIAGDFRIRVRTFPDIKLSNVETAIKEAFAKFEKDGFTEQDIERIKAKTETNFYNGISSVFMKSYQLALYNEFAGSPDFISKDLQNTLDVTKADVMRVYNKYIKDKPYVLTSFVPKGRKDLAAGNSVLFPIKEEKVEEQGKVSSGEENNVSGEIKTEEIVSSFDRNIEPPVGPDPVLKVPPVWSGELSNGIKIYGIEYKELPLVQFAITVKGGMLMDDPDKIGVANLITDEMMQGTRNKTPIELEEAIDDLGATINMYTTKQSIVIEASCLASKFEDTYKLVEEILFEPRWDKKEFDRVKNETIESIKRKKVDPSSVAASVFNKLIYGKNNIIANDTYGTVESVQAITVDDLKNYYENNFAPRLAFITIAGEVPEDNAVKLFRSLENKWQKKDVQLPGINVPEKPEHPSIYFVDFPNAKQSAIRIGTLGLKYTDPDYYKAVVMNYKLGGSFNGRVNMILREEKGYTYGARTSFSAALYPGTFVALSNVRTNTTFESVKIFMDELNKYRQGISEEDLQFTKNALIKSNARRFETLGALRGMLNNIALYNLPFDYVKEQENIIKNMTLDEHKAIAQKYIQPDRMIYVIAGDAKTQMDKLKNLGIGTPVLLDREGNPVK
ncbi:peptidase M16 inactive domain protein [bacterium BMS3Abin03]|nr:peptidase M16 inactive domain protein [bacterium BMS3Abin03]